MVYEKDSQEGFLKRIGMSLCKKYTATFFGIVAKRPSYSLVGTESKVLGIRRDGMEYQNEHQRQKAILEAALPYVAPSSRHAIQMFLQMDSLVALARNNNGGENGGYSLEAAEHNQFSSEKRINNVQEMLLQIQEHLTQRESEMVQMVLNFMNTGKLFRRYREFNRNETSNTSLRDFLISQMNPEQKASFEQLQNIMYNE